jgi:hypothetical protein
MFGIAGSADVPESDEQGQPPNTEGDTTDVDQAEHEGIDERTAVVDQSRQSSHSLATAVAANDHGT